MSHIDHKKIKTTFYKAKNQEFAGLSCLVSIIRYYGGDVNVHDLLKNSGASVETVSLLGLCQAAQKANFEANGYKADIEFIEEQNVPLILHIDKGRGHEDFIVVYGFYNNKYVVGDPQWGITEYRKDELEAVWKSKILMLMEPNCSFKTVIEERKLKRESLFKLLKTQKRAICFIASLGLISSVALSMVISLLGNHLSNSMFGEEIDSRLMTYSPPLFLIFIAGVIIYVNISFVTKTEKPFVSELNEYLNRIIFSKGSEKELQSAGQINSRLEANGHFKKSVVNFFWGICFYIPLVLFVIVEILNVDTITGVLLFVGVIVLTGLFYIKSKKINHLYSRFYNFEAQKIDIIQNTLNSSYQIELTNNQALFRRMNRNTLNFFYETKARLKKAKSQWQIYLVIFLVVVLIVWLNSSNSTRIFNIEKVIWLLVYFLTLEGIVSTIALGYIEAQASFNYLSRSSLDHVPLIGNNIPQDLKVSAQKINKFSVDNFSFSFPGKKALIRDFSFVAEIGRITIVYGKSGSGKSILSMVLSRLLSGSTGVIRIDDKKWEKINNFQWRMIASSVLQPTYLPSTTVIRCIGWGNNSIDPDKIEMFCAELGFDKFVNHFIDGYLTLTDKLSEGQKQLVALVAAVYRKSQILILDEPFVHMDKEMKNFSFQVIQKLKSEMIIIVLTKNENFTEGTVEKFSIDK